MIRDIQTDARFYLMRDIDTRVGRGDTGSIYSNNWGCQLLKKKQPTQHSTDVFDSDFILHSSTTRGKLSKS